MAEDAGTLELTVELNQAPLEAVEVTVTASPGSGGMAELGTDYRLRGDADGDGSITLTFPAGAGRSDRTRTVTFDIVDDAVPEGAERFTARLADPDGGNAVLAATGTTATVTITGDDSLISASAPRLP